MLDEVLKQIRDMLNALPAALAPLGAQGTPLDQRLNFVRSQQPRLEVPPEEIDLSTARDDLEWPVQGDSLLVVDATGKLEVRFNERHNPKHNLQLERGFVMVGPESGFYRIFLTNTAQAGKTCTVAIGKDMGFRVFQGLSASKITDAAGADINPMEDNVLDLTPTNGAVNVATTTTAVLAANAARGYALIVNDSDTTIYLALGANAVVNQGIPIRANGGFYEINRQNLFRGAVNGIHGGAGTKVVTIVDADEA